MISNESLYLTDSIVPLVSFFRSFLWLTGSFISGVLALISYKFHQMTPHLSSRTGQSQKSTIGVLLVHDLQSRSSFRYYLLAYICMRCSMRSLGRQIVTLSLKLSPGPGQARPGGASSYAARCMRFFLQEI